ncbi:MAG: hypothetical protein IT169_10085 [Bryobacterales bacterium]|nr:hypothetical protein [Bryobacterales bacterium]
MPVSPAEVPELITKMAEFLSRMRSMGAEVAFWRAKSNAAELSRFRAALLHLSQHPEWMQDSATQIAKHIRAFEELHRTIGALVAEVPFDSRVNLIHRSLISVYQQIYILDNLVTSLLLRLTRQGKVSEGSSLQAGSLLSVESRREVRAQFREVVPSWDRRDWDLYDDL